MMIAMLLVCAAATHAQITQAEITATGLTCSMCSNAINKQLKAMPEVESVTTDLNTNTFTVQLKKDNQITPLRLKQRVEKAGFFVGSMIITLERSGLTAVDPMHWTQKDDTYVWVDSVPEPTAAPCKAKVIDRGFVTAKEYKKWRKLLGNHPTYLAGAENTVHLKTL